MVGIGSVIQFQYPNAKVLIDFRVENDTINDHIVYWNTGLLGAQPSEATLATIQASAPYIAWNTPSEAAKRLLASKGATIGVVSVVRKTANQPFTTTVFADVTDLTFQLLPNKHYMFSFKGAYSSALATTGLQLSVNGPASPSFIRFIGRISSSVTAVLNGAGGGYDVAIAGTASAAAVELPFFIEGTISTGSAGGAFSLRARSEINASAVNILRGCWGELAAIET